MANESTSSIVARVALGSLAVGLVVLALKAAAAWLTGKPPGSYSLDDVLGIRSS